MSEPVVGIDLGTTNSEVAFVFDRHPRVLKLDDAGIVPSCVGLDRESRIIVGTEARNQYIAAPERTIVSIKRKMGSNERVWMGDQSYSPQEISAFILKALKERAEKVLERRVSKVVITVPAYFTDAQRQATREAGEIAGLEVVRIINEPTAAALAYESRSEGRRKLLIYDLGGGTFDVSVVSIESGVVEVLASTGDTHLGGDDFDRLIVQRLIEHIESDLGISVQGNRALRARLTRAAEAAKIELSSRPYARIQEDHIGEVNGTPRHLSFELSRLDFEQMIDESLIRTMELVSRALTDAGMTPAQLDKILLVGGSTRIPRIAQLLGERLGQEPHGEMDPDLCVALGASVQAGIEMGVDVESVLVDITPYTFGTSAVRVIDGVPHFDTFVPLIRRNTRIPVSLTEVFYTLFDDQEAVDVRVYQGENPDALQNVLIGNFLFKELNTTPEANQQGILVTYSLNLDGILEVHAVERATGKEIRAVVENAMGRSNADELRASRDRVAELWNPGTATAAPPNGAPAEAEQNLMPQLAQLLERSQKVLDSASAEDRREMMDLMQQIRDSCRNGLPQQTQAFKQQLEEILFYLE